MIVDSVFNKWNINKLPRQKGAQGNYGGSTVINRNENNVQNTGIEGHYLWGNYFDATQDINGDINTQGDVNFYGNLNYQGNYDPDDELHGNLNIGRINAEDGNIKNINSDLIKAAEAYIENLTVTGSAHFFELIIDKIRSVGGAIMLTPADGFELYGYNVKTSNQINLWWVKTDDRNGKYNQWVVGDQALCRNFDAAKVGKSYNIQNKYWWAKVVDVNTTGQWVVKLYDNQYNRDEVMALPIGNNNAYYNNTHGYLKKSDFQLTTDYVYVYIVPEIIGGETVYHRDRWITNEEYYRLDDNEKAEYEFSQLYVHENGDGSVIKITELQYENTDIDEVDLLIYDEIADDWKLLRSFCKADCKFCYNITIDKSIAATGSIFSVTESGNTAWVFQEGDNIIMIGHQKQQTETEEEAANRQNAIYLNAGGQGDSLDTDLRPPFFAQYKGINDFNLTNHRLTWFSGGFVGTQGSAGYPYANNIQGNLRISSTDPNIDGENVQDYVNSQIIVAEDRITAEVTENVNGELERTGIDIENGTITLDAAKTIVTGELNFGNQNSGMVLYDDKGAPIIRIANDPIGNFSDFNNSLNYYQYIRGVVNQLPWNIETDIGKIGTWNSGSSILIKNFGINEYVENNGQFIRPSSNTCTIRIDLMLNGSSVDHKSVTATKNSAGTYFYNGSVTFDNLNGGSYGIKVTTTDITGTAPVNKIIYNFEYGFEYSNNKLVRLADGGFSSNPAPNSFIWSNSEMQIMRQGSNAIRVYNGNGETNSRGVEVLANTTYNIWHNYSNYIPTKTISFDDLSYGSITGVSGSVYYYEIDPHDGYGQILIYPMTGAGIGSNDVYIRLPQCSPVGTLIEVGYHISIWDCDFDNKVHVIDYDGKKILQGGLTDVSQCILSNGNSNGNFHGSDFIHIGQITTSEGNSVNWRSTMPFS